MISDNVIAANAPAANEVVGDDLEQLMLMGVGNVDVALQDSFAAGGDDVEMVDEIEADKENQAKEANKLASSE